MRINTNIASLTAQEAAVNVNKNLSSSLEKLSTGLRINKASDDASGMAIADKLRTQASAIGQGIANANSANTFIQIADKAMGEQSNILDIVKTKLMQATTSTTSENGRKAIGKDIKALLQQFNNISNSTNYNGTDLLNGTSPFSFQIGESATNDTVTVDRSQAILTTSLGGSTSTAVTSIAADATTTLKETVQNTAITIKSASGEDLNSSVISGKIQALGTEASGEISFTATDDASRAIFDTAVESNDAFTSTGTGSSTVYTLAASAQINIGDQNISFKITDSVAEKELSIDSDSAVTVSNGNTEALVVTGATGYGNLDTIKSAGAAGTMTEQNAKDWMTLVDTALTELNTARSSFGSAQNQVESALRNMMTTKTNIKAAESIIRDVDYAAESANFNKQNIIAQAGTYAISQANNVQQNVLKLLQ